MNKLLSAIVRLLLTPFFHGIVCMPGRSHKGTLPGLNHHEKLLQSRLQQHVVKLSRDIGDRSLHSPDKLLEAAAYFSAELTSYGYQTETQDFFFGSKKLSNIEASLPGTQAPEKVLIVGAHYDTVPGTPGADDNASGIAALLELARYFAGRPQPITIRFVAFSHEETQDYTSMGSYAYAKRCRQQNEELVGMFSLEMLGAFFQAEGSQKYPFPFSLLYPGKADFIAFVGNTASQEFLHRSIGAFRKLCKFPSQGCAAPVWLYDASRSDHLPFWKLNYPAVMITDTSNFRYPYYHGAEDTADKLDMESMTRVVAGIALMIEALASA